MKHAAIQQVLRRSEMAKSDSDFTYFFSLLLSAEAIVKTIVLGMVAAIADDKDRHRYRLEHKLMRSDGLGTWSEVLEDALTGPASHFLIVEAREEQSEFTKSFIEGDWQYDATVALSNALDSLGIQSESVPLKSDLKRWFRLFATLRNKTRAHGATLPEGAAVAAPLIEKSISLISENLRLFRRSWAHIHRNLSGKYRVSIITEDHGEFDQLKGVNNIQLQDGIYISMGGYRRVSLMQTNAELTDFYFANGGYKGKSYELLSYSTDNKSIGDTSGFQIPPSNLPSSETEGNGELLPQGNCFSNVPEVIRDYVDRAELEDQLKGLLLDDKRPIVTLVGRGGIGKTSLALKVIQKLHETSRFEVIVWLSARDVDLQISGPKPVRPSVLSPAEMAKYYASLVLSKDKLSDKGFDATQYFERQLQDCEMGTCLFVFDNFETTQNPIDVFNWIDAHIRLPNKVLITTRLREFKGDYPIDVNGMREQESRILVSQTVRSLGISDLLSESYITDLIRRSEGHPYIIKILLGEVAKAGRAGDIPLLIAGTEDILTALFERTYAALSPCSQRAFLTLSAWNSSVPRIALEAVLYRSTEERNEVERGIEMLLQYSMAEMHAAATDGEDFISLPLVASVFGKKKLNISPSKAAIQADVEILQMFGPSRNDDIRLGLARKLEGFLGRISARIAKGESYESHRPILEAICRKYNPGWLLLARWHMEERTTEGYEYAKEELRRFLEENAHSPNSAEAWKSLGHACYQTGDELGMIHAYIEAARQTTVTFYDLSNTANLLNRYLTNNGFAMDGEHKRALSTQILDIMLSRKAEAATSDLSRMAWLAINAGKESVARELVINGLELDGNDYHLIKVGQRLGIAA